MGVKKASIFVLSCQSMRWPQRELKLFDIVIPSHGQATITPTDDVMAGSYGTWTLTLTVGQHGIDDGARVPIAAGLLRSGASGGELW